MDLRRKHGGLVANQITAVTMAGNCSQLSVINRSQSVAGGEIYFTVDGTDPVVGADNTYVAIGACIALVPYNTYLITVKLISAQNLSFTVRSDYQ